MIPGLIDNRFKIRTWNSQLIESHITKEKLEKILREWEGHVLPDEKRQKAVKNILKFYSQETTITTYEGKGDLSFYNYELRSLPDIFSYLPFRRLTAIDLTGCFLQQLPDSFSQLEKLKSLHLENNKLEEVPAAISSLFNLIELNLSENRLKQLPSNLTQLIYLEDLNLEQNSFEEFPESLTQLINLRIFDISENNLSVLPENFHWPKYLTLLSLRNNKLSCLPEKLYGLKKLSNIYLSGNEFTNISPLLSKFSEFVCIECSGNRLSEEEVRRVIQITNAPNYNGPDIEGLSIASESESEMEEEKGKIHDKLHTVADLAPQSFTNLPHSNELQTWLNRLLETTDFRPKENIKAITQKVLSILYPQEWERIKKEKAQVTEQACFPKDYIKVQEEFNTKISEGLEGTSRQYPSLVIPAVESTSNVSEDSSAQKGSLKRKLGTPGTHSEGALENGKKTCVDESE